MRLTLTRTDFLADRTLGVLAVDGLHHSWTLEDVVRPEGEPKVWGKTAIPFGSYKLGARYSPRFKRTVIQILNVPDFSLVYFHGGNKPEDTEGCILLGADKDENEIHNSAAVVAALESFVFKELHLGEVWVDIVKGGAA